MQPVVFNDVMEQRASNPGVVGLMLESNIREGSQSLGEPSELDYGVSITDACIGWPETEELVRSAHARLEG
jgi:3-deoxy-7-phosphoheptulonate synthase